MRARVEDFGAWVRLDDRTLVAVDRRRAAALGLAGPWSGPQPPDIRGPTAPLEAHVAITERCPLSCAGCYQPTRVDGAHASLDRLRATLDEVRAAGAFMVAFGGGEPLTHPDLPALAREARARDLVPVVTTSGIGLTAERARALTHFAQVNVSYDGANSELRASETVAVAERAIAALVAAGVTVGVNVVLTRRSVVALEDTCARAPRPSAPSRRSCSGTSRRGARAPSTTSSDASRPRRWRSCPRCCGASWIEEPSRCASTARSCRSSRSRTRRRSTRSR